MARAHFRRARAVVATIALAVVLTPGPALAPGQRIPPADVPVPPEATEVDRNDGIEMITFRSALTPEEVRAFYRGALGTLGWTMDEEDSYLVAGVGSLTFAKGDEEFRVVIQDGRPASRTRMLVMGEGVAWAPSEWEALDGEEVPAPAAAGPLVASADHALPVPEGCESVGSSKTPFRRTVDAEIRRPLADVVAFYRRELPARGWTTVTREDDTPGERLTLDVDGAPGPLRVEIRKKRKDTLIHLATRDAASARKAGVIPEAGQARLLLANAREAGEATIVVDGTTRTIAAGTGAADPAAALSLTLAPGVHEVTIKIPGAPDATETLTLGADETWAVMVMDGAGYFADRVY